MSRGHYVLNSPEELTDKLTVFVVVESSTFTSSRKPSTIMFRTTPFVISVVLENSDFQIQMLVESRNVEKMLLKEEGKSGNSALEVFLREYAI